MLLWKWVPNSCLQVLYNVGEVIIIIIQRKQRRLKRDCRIRGDGTKTLFYHWNLSFISKFGFSFLQLKLFDESWKGRLKPAKIFNTHFSDHHSLNKKRLHCLQHSQETSEEKEINWWSCHFINTFFQFLFFIFTLNNWQISRHVNKNRYCFTIKTSEILAVIFYSLPGKRMAKFPQSKYVCSAADLRGRTWWNAPSFWSSLRQQPS